MCGFPNALDWPSTFFSLYAAINVLFCIKNRTCSLISFNFSFPHLKFSPTFSTNSLEHYNQQPNTLMSPFAWAFNVNVSPRGENRKQVCAFSHLNYIPVRNSDFVFPSFIGLCDLRSLERTTECRTV